MELKKQHNHANIKDSIESFVLEKLMIRKYNIRRAEKAGGR